MTFSKTINSTVSLYKEAYSNHPKEIWSLAFLTLINRMGTMVIPFLTVYLTTVLNFSLKEGGIIASAFGLGSLVGTYVGGKLSDKFGGNPVIIGSLFFGGLCFIVLQWFSTLYGLFAMIFVTAMFGESYRPAMMVSMASYVPSSATGRSASLLRLAINLGMSISPLVAGILAVEYGYHLLFWVDGLTCISAAIYFFFLIRNWKKRESPLTTTPTSINKISKKPLIPPYKNGQYLLFLVATFLMAFVFMQWFYSVPVFLKSEWGFDEKQIGIILGFSSFLVILTEMPLIHSLEKANRQGTAVRIGLLSMGISFLFFLLPSALYLCFIAITLWTIGEILILPFNMSLALTMSPVENRGDYQGWYGGTWSLVQIAGASISLVFAETFGFPTLWIGLLVMTIFSLLLYRVVHLPKNNH